MAEFDNTFQAMLHLFDGIPRVEYSIVYMGNNVQPQCIDVPIDQSLAVQAKNGKIMWDRRLELFKKCSYSHVLAALPWWNEQLCKT